MSARRSARQRLPPIRGGRSGGRQNNGARQGDALDGNPRAIGSTVCAQDSGRRCRRKDGDQMQTTDDQRAQLAEAGAMLTELSGYARKAATGFINPAEERRAAELAADARSAVQKCAAILRSMTN